MDSMLLLMSDTSCKASFCHANPAFIKNQEAVNDRNFQQVEKQLLETFI